jgi:DNA-binding NarL/FixJ family response regulator
MRDAIQATLERAGHRAVGSTGRREDVVALVTAVRPDLVIMDLLLRGEDATDVLRQLTSRVPQIPVLVYSGVVQHHRIRAAIDAGARGFLSKEGSEAQLRAAIEAVGARRAWLDPRLERGPGLTMLTVREREVIGLLARGLSGTRVASELTLAPETVRSHVKSAMAKLGARTRSQAIVQAVLRGEVDVE